ncbi:MAG: VacJ family lipoprotein [Thermodesulfobacteriota bacterium]
MKSQKKSAGGDAIIPKHHANTGGRSRGAELRLLLLIFLLGLIASAVPVSAQTVEAPESEFDEFDEFEDMDQEPAPEIYDPLIGYNRVMTRVNDRLYFWVLKPAAQGYGAVVPEGARVCISNFFDNLAFPIRFVNNLLQLKFKGAGVETARFGVNTTVGIAGLWDPAKNWLDLSPYEEDFGQTLDHYGVNGGVPFVLPALGPSNLRDSLGRVPDGYLDPVEYIDGSAVQIGAPVFEIINRTSLHIGEYESFRKDAMDLYILMRSAYQQNRENAIEE